MGKNEQTLKEILLQVVGAPQIKDKYLLQSIKDAWKQCFGPTIQQYTTDIRFRNGILTVVLNSAPLKHELSLSKEKIIKIMNETLKAEHIRAVHIY
jgi:hypothetical protein